jgi:hypothetical protein
MYLNVFGGSALLHLLLGHPRLILALGIAGTVAVANTPHGPGRHIGTAQYLARLEATIGGRAANDDATMKAARQSVTNLLETYDPPTIENVVAETLHACGRGCTDLSTPIVIRDAELLRRVLLIHELDRLSVRDRIVDNRSGDERPAGATAQQ